jgi:asparagine synthase (glutamine-hydrolysing)
MVARHGDAWNRYLSEPRAETLKDLASEDADLLLGHTRLAILDLSQSADQPMANEDGTIWTVFNGEIYNYREIRTVLEGRGHVFRTDHSDTEVLVHGYEEWGEQLVDRLRGMFAFAILSLRTRKLFMARDRFGEKPLYIAANARGIAFASELKALLASGTCGREICHEALRDYLVHGFIPAPRSIFRGVVKLAAAELVTVDLDHPERCHPRVYWRPSCHADHGLSDQQVLEDFGRVLHESVQLRMQSDVPLGAFLSGGLDSTIVVRHMVQSSDQQINTFNIGFKHSKFDESPFSSEASRRYRTNHHVELLEPSEMLDLLPIIERQYDEPFADASAIPTLMVSRMARRHVTVALSGDGGDELLCGYSYYALLHRMGRWLRPLPRAARGVLSRSLRRLWPQSVRGYGLLNLLDVDDHARFMRYWSDDFFTGAPGTSGAPAPGEILREHWSRIPGAGVERMAAVDSRFYIPEDLMVKVDRASMAVSLEARAPLLDHVLFDAAARIPLGLRFDGRLGKLPFRTSLTADLGAAFVNRPKQGFAVPLGAWFRGPLREQLHATLLDPDGIVADILPRQKAQTLIDMHLQGSRDQSHRLWRLFVLQRWYSVYGRAPALSAAC